MADKIGFGKNTGGQWEQFNPGDRLVNSAGFLINNLAFFDTLVDPLGSGDYTTIQDAIDGGGVHILLKNGAYSITTQIEIDNTDPVQSITGESRTGVVLTSSSTTNHIFNISGTLVSSTGTLSFAQDSLAVTGVGTTFSTDGVTAGDFVISSSNSIYYDNRGYKVATVGSNTSITLDNTYRWPTFAVGALDTVIFRPVKNLTMENFTMVKLGNSGNAKLCINGQYCNNILLRNLHLNSGSDGNQNSLSTFLYSDRIRVIQNEFSNGHSGAGTTAVGFVRSGDCGVSWNVFRGGSTSGTMGVSSTRSTHIEVSHNIGNYVGLGDNLSGSVSYLENTINSGSIASINIFGGQSRSKIISNTLTRGYISVNGQTGDGFVVSGNTVLSSPGDGITADSVSCVITGNVVQYSTGHGISLTDSNNGTPSLISSNYCRSNTLSGISLNTSGNSSLVTGNRIISSGTYGIQVLDGTGHRLLNNEILASGTAMILDSGIGTIKVLNTSANTQAIVGLDNLGVSGVALLSTTSGIDAFAVATTTLYTVPTGKTVMVDHVEVELTAASGITVGGTGGVGVAAGEDDIIASTVLTDLIATGLHNKLEHKNAAAIATSTQAIKWGNDAAPTGTSGTYRIRLYGTEY